MEDIHNKSVIALANRLSEINIERDKLDMEELAIMHELWNRIPSLKDDVNLQPKVMIKSLGGGNEKKTK